MLKNFELVKKIAAALNGTWEAKEKIYDSHNSDDSGHRIVAPNGAGICLIFPTYPKVNLTRILISGIWPERQRGSEVTPGMIYRDNEKLTVPSMSVSRDKAPEVIAKNLEDRFLPEYLPLYGACVVEGMRLNQSEADELRMKQELVTLFGGGKLSEQEARPFAPLYARGSTFPGLTYIQELRVNPDNDTISMDIRQIPYDLALEFLGRLKRRGMNSK